MPTCTCSCGDFTIEWHVITTLFLTGVMYVIGTAVTYFEGTPESWSAVSHDSSSHGSFLAHVIFGCLVLVMVIILFVRIFYENRNTWPWLLGTSLALIGVAMGVGTGVDYVNTHEASEGYAMSWGFVLLVAGLLMPLFWHSARTARFTPVAASDSTSPTSPTIGAGAAARVGPVAASAGLNLLP